MKKKQPFIWAAVIIAVCSIQSLYAQNTSPYWSLAGNSNATSTSSLGTTNLQSLRFVTNSKLGMIINTSGNVGIGTSNPLYKLHVNTSGAIGTYSSAATNGIKGISTSSSDTAAGIWGKGSIGIRGYSTVYSGIGIAGEAPYDLFNGWDGIGVYGKGDYGVKADGQKYGVYATASTSSEDYGLCECVAGTGVYGSGYTGVEGSGTSGVVGRSSGSTPYNIGAGVSGYGNYGVIGISSQTDSVDERGYQKIGVKAFGYYGVYAEGNSTTGYGVVGAGRYGIRGAGYYGLYGTGNYGVYGLATATYGYGVYGRSTNYIGVYGSTSASNNNYAGYFNGNVYCVNTYLGSDAKLKKNIKSMDKALDIIDKLLPKYYEFRNDGNYAKMHLPKGNHFGLLAQDVEKVLPDLVKETQFNVTAETMDEQTDKTANAFDKPEMINFKAVNYTELIPVLIKATQELNEKVNELTRQNEILNNKIIQLENNRINIKSEISLTDKILLQNNPNPVSGNTTISYMLPDKFSNAQIMINDKSGKLLKQLNVSGKGKGNLNVDISSFPSGTYNYSLVVDGNVSSTKQLVIAR
jgi:Chaperone of endosialidase/Secretion system C-terminal sorting domain